MRYIQQSAEVEKVDGVEVLRKIERIGRICYNSLDKITPTSYEGFVRGLIASGHESVLEHVSLTATVVVNRAIAQEITRHRIGSYTHESTRYIKYKDLRVIVDPMLQSEYTDTVLENVEELYIHGLNRGLPRELMRDILPLATASTLVMTYNLRQWRHFFKLRYLGTTGRPHPQIKALAGELLTQMQGMIPVVFDDMKEVE